MTETAEHLQKKAWEGLRHISEMLGQPIFDDSSSISDVVRDIEATLEKLIDEKQKIDLVNQAVETGKYSRAGTPKDPVI